MFQPRHLRHNEAVPSPKYIVCFSPATPTTMKLSPSLIQLYIVCFSPATPTTMKLSPLPPPATDSGGETDAEFRARLSDSLAISYPGTTLSRALASMAAADSGSDSESHPLSQSCFAELRLDKVKLEELEEEEEDDELTSLAWLQDSDLLKNIKTGDRSIGTSPPPEDMQKENNSLQHPPHVPYNPQKHVNTKPPYSFSCMIFMAIVYSPD